MPGVPVELPFNNTLGETVPPDTPHAVSVSLPTWRSNVGYEEGEQWVLEKMQCGYPRFFIHKIIQRLARTIVEQHGAPDQDLAMLFPTITCAKRCVAFISHNNPSLEQSRLCILEFVPVESNASQFVQPHLCAVLYPKELWPTAKAFWQHTGEGIQSRRAEFCLQALESKTMVLSTPQSSIITPIAKGPRRYQRLSTDKTLSKGSTTHTNGNTPERNGVAVPDSAQFVEERFGRNLDVTFASQAKLAVRKRIAGSLTSQAELPDSLNDATDLSRQRSRDVPGFSVDDVFLYPCGMNAIFHAHLALRLAVREDKSVMYGFPYVDTLKVLEKFGAGAEFYGHGNAADLDHLEKRLENGERFLSLFCEFPGNPLLKTPDLKRIRSLADKYDFAVVIDETIGNFLNVHVLPYADILVSSLTKIFSGDSNVMGGCMIVNPRSQYYNRIKEHFNEHYEDNQFEGDSVYLERNSRDFVGRIQRINHNAELIADILRSHSAVKHVNYPKYSDTKAFYDACRLPDGGYGGLLSAVFHRVEDAAVFYDHLDTQKGPSLGTNFTLSSPFVLLAHYTELDWAAQFGCEVSLVRFSVGLEDADRLRTVFGNALAAIPS
ncbi:pyridoxal phosphate-dependent transferase [Neohortaea acidophila]|uniref:cystathionine gamma-synthase n=1 Tax=Neohortaea acidophila TaxID=245834 RepID=A0A6A6PP72_9PEZI|nr:pyridoxal phosphate-dependent transferase [Neohortaea acidophila]KAF2481888.1 pyridoxal phosphate-dependent transferase [Neohortaea acidophila]